MSITVIAHYCRGHASSFPAGLEGVAAEGCNFKNENPNFAGGVIVASFDTDDKDLIMSSFKEHLKNNDLSALALHKTGARSFLFSETSGYIF